MPVAGYHIVHPHQLDPSQLQYGGGGDQMTLSPIVFPYGVNPSQQPVFAVPHGGGFYQHYLPVVQGGAQEDGSFSHADEARHTNGGDVASPNARNNKKSNKESRDALDDASGKPRGRRRRSRRSKDRQQALQENIRKTVYISDLDQQITEEQLATFFLDCGIVVDCRMCGDPNSAMRFAFVEFNKEAEAVAALKKTGLQLGSSRLKVLPSKTAIVPVNKELMPKNKDEMEQCSRTVYATNIDKKVDRDDVQRFFEALCGPVSALRLLGDHAHSTRIAFVEFVHADSALAALSCSGALLGTMPIRVSPSKTPVRAKDVEMDD
ncbi:hypothetical protein BSKO_08524 [Bryopsis sp. KO-2023]|nr:hypothetical protein BSKO_08524 [Bryopsis sp. KO-2023]